MIREARKDERKYDKVMGSIPKVYETNKMEINIKCEYKSFLP